MLILTYAKWQLFSSGLSVAIYIPVGCGYPVIILKVSVIKILLLIEFHTPFEGGQGWIQDFLFVLGRGGEHL